MLHIAVSVCWPLNLNINHAAHLNPFHSPAIKYAVVGSRTTARHRTVCSACTTAVLRKKPCLSDLLFAWVLCIERALATCFSPLCFINRNSCYFLKDISKNLYFLSDFIGTISLCQSYSLAVYNYSFFLQTMHSHQLLHPFLKVI